MCAPPALCKVIGTLVQCSAVQCAVLVQKQQQQRQRLCRYKQGLVLVYVCVVSLQGPNHPATAGALVEMGSPQLQAGGMPLSRHFTHGPFL